MPDYPLLPDPKEKIPQENILDHFLDYVAKQKLTLYPAQEEAILELYAGSNVILNTPTGSGKSLVASALHFQALVKKKRSFYTSPIKALVNEKFFNLCREFSPEKVGMLTGDAAVNPLAPIICCTAEVLSNMALREGERTIIDDVIMDEFHYYGDRERGIAWQVPLLTLKHSRFLLMSATLGETEFFEKALTKLTQRPTITIRSTSRPVPLTFRYIDDVTLEQTVQDLLQEGKAPLYLVNFTQRECADNAQKFMSINFCTKEEKEKIAAAIDDKAFTSPYGKEIKKFLKHGIGIHHAGILPKYRVLTEILAQKGLLKIISGTDTLGVGINVPIRTVVFSKMCKFDGEKMIRLASRDFHQISGRAGRKGFDDQGFVVVMAPEHVIINRKQEQKAQANPQLKKKMVKAKPPEKGFLTWDEEFFQKLKDSPPEKLQSSFQMSHSLLLNVLGRQFEDGCLAMKDLLRQSHESPKAKEHHRKRGMMLFRSLIDRKIIEFIPKEERRASKLRINTDLQGDFSLDQTLSLYLLDTMKFFDPMDENYPVNLLSLTESILENPTIILLRQLDHIKGEAMQEMKERGLEYEERIAELEKLEYPKPMGEMIYETFNKFVNKHPWVGEENIRPKGIAREMYETFQSFPDYIRSYELHRSEGLLLRYLSSVYKVLAQTIPNDLKNDAVDELIVYFETIIKAVDSSLLDEWQKLKDPTYKPEEKSLTPAIFADDITKNERAFGILIRNKIFNFLRQLARRNYGGALYILYPDKIQPNDDWPFERLAETMDKYFANHDRIILDTHTRNPKNMVIKVMEGSGNRSVELTILDDKELNDWVVKFEVDTVLSQKENEPVVKLVDLNPVV